ncbi:MAG: hypothetical protein RL660_408 [Bacteroidota bacterium]
MLKSICLAATCLLVLSTASIAQTAKKTVRKPKPAKATTTTPATAKPAPAKKEEATEEIQWLTWQQAQDKMAQQPRKVYVDVYTDWCGWCKVMDSKTFKDPRVAKFMNENFYCIKFNAEKDNDVPFQGKIYSIENGVNELADKLMNGKRSYPTSIILMENFQNPMPVPGYLDIPNFEVIMHYLQTNSHTRIPFEEYKKSYVYLWK